MRPEFLKEELIDLHNDVGFAKLASFAPFLTPEEMATDVEKLIEKQAYAEDATYADDINRMFSIATPVETKLSALYATKCASLLDQTVVDRINDACNVYGIDIQVPVINKTASVFDDPSLYAAIDEFEREYIDAEDVENELGKYASANEYGTELDTCLAARAFFARNAEDVEAIEELAKIAHVIPPAQMVEMIAEIDSELGIDNPYMQSRIGTPEFAVYEKVASENMVNLGGPRAVPLAAIEPFQDEIKDMGVDLDWDGSSGDQLQLQLEALPSQIKGEINSWIK